MLGKEKKEKSERKVSHLNSEDDMPVCPLFGPCQMSQDESCDSLLSLSPFGLGFQMSVIICTDLCLKKQEFIL